MLGFNLEFSSAASSLNGDESPTNKSDGTLIFDLPSSVLAKLIHVRLFTDDISSNKFA